MFGQSTAAPSPLAAARPAQGQVRLLRFGIRFGDRLLDVFECQVQLVRVELLRAPAELHPLQLADKVAQALVLFLQATAFGALGIQRRAHRQYRSA
jgi:hypothetical protein